LNSFTALSGTEGTLSLHDDFRGKKFVVTGGEGFIGSHIVEALLEREGEVIVIDDLSNGASRLKHLNSEKLSIYHEDIRRFNFESLGKVECVFNEAARALIPSFRDPITDLEVNVGGTIKVLDYARKFKTKVVHASSGSVYGNPERIPITEEHPLRPISPYGTSKLAAESYCGFYYRTYGVDVVMLRYFNVYGPRQSVSEEMGVIPIFVERALTRNRLTIFGDGSQTRDFLNIKDVVRANLEAYVAQGVSGKAVNIGGGGREISILDLAKLVMQLCSYDSEVIFKPAKPGDIRRLVADNSMAASLLGYHPQVNLEEGLVEYIQYVKDKHS
jgi:UDP-glucose 4-epimerase